MQPPTPVAGGASGPPKMNFAAMASLAKNKMVALPKMDPVKEHVKKKLEKFDIKEEAEITKVKELLESLKDFKSGKKTAPSTAATVGGKPSESKESKEPAPSTSDAKDLTEASAEEEESRPRREGALCFDLFMKVKEFSLCTEEKFKSEHCVNMLMVERDKDCKLVEAKANKQGGKDGGGRGRGQWRGNKDDRYQQPRYNPDKPIGLQRQKVDENVLKLAEIAKKRMEEIKTRKADPKTQNKIKLILNLLSADNFEKNLIKLK